jgi:hypothetical protein
MSYDTNWAHSSSDSDVRRLKKEADKLARIACAAMTELEKMGKEDFLILKNEEVGHWWASHKEADRKERERVAELERRERLKKEALDRLTDEEKELLGLKKPIVKKNKKVKNSNAWDDPDVEEIEIMLEDLKSAYDSIMIRK